MNGQRRSANPTNMGVGAGSKLPSKFMAGRGRALHMMKSMPLEAEEFAKRKRMQELFVKGEISLPEDNIPHSLLRLQTSHSIKEMARKNQTLSQQESPSITTNVLFNTSGQTKVNATSHPEFTDRTMKSIPKATGFAEEKEEQHVGELKVLNVDDKAAKEMTKDNPDSFLSNSKTSKPLRRPDKFKNKSVNFVKSEENTLEGNKEASKGVETNFVTSKEPNQKTRRAWIDWEQNVVVEGLLADEDLQELVKVDDNDDIHDVIVDQYVDALHREQRKETSNSNKITPNRVQRLSNLKSTSNADCMRVAPGTLPNPPKGDDRWGGSELKSVTEPMGWGDVDSDNVNWYNDGSSYWGADAAKPYGGVSWSNCS